MNEKLAKDILELAKKHKFDIAIPKNAEGSIGDIQVLIDTKQKKVIFKPNVEDFDDYSLKQEE